MKIAILTHPLGTNYGGLLQNYALQQVLAGLGHEPVTLNHRFGIPGYVKALSFLKRLGLRLRGRRVPLRGWPTAREAAAITANTRAFMEKYIRTTASFALRDTKRLTAEKADAIIVGSDQVWRGSSPDVACFFLKDFEAQAVVKLAYAASFGVEEWEFSAKETRRCARLAKQFRAVTVREQSGIRLCREHLDIEAGLALDPALLLDAAAYDRLLPPRAEGDFLMSYLLDPSEAKREIAAAAAARLGLRTRTVQATAHFVEVGRAGLADCVLPPVEDWLAAIRDAAFVVTDSFHGVVFCLVYRKRFAVIPNSKRGVARFRSLLSLIGLERRMVQTVAGLEAVLAEEIDYETVSAALARLRAESVDFLRRNLV